MKPVRLVNTIRFCLNYSDDCYKCELFNRGRCNGVRFLLEEAVKFIEEVLNNGMANN